MSIKIKKMTGEVFDLPVDYVIEVEKNNPVFEKKGSQTVPIGFPATKKNIRLLNFPNQLENASLPKQTIPVAVENGATQQCGLLSINSAGGGIISSNIGFDESEMYAQMEKIQLKNMKHLDVAGVTHLQFGGNNIDEKIDSMLAHITSVMKQEIDSDYSVFPLVLKEYEFTGEDEQKHKAFDILNDINAGYSNSNVAIGELKALENRMIIRYEGDESIELSAPKGYGVSPFLKVWRILELIFGHFGFTISENFFKDHVQLQKLAALNNVMDCILTGELHYKDMMPDVTIRGFLDSLYNKFGMLYFIDSNSKTVRIKLLKNLLSTEILPGMTHPVSDIIDLNPYKAEEPVITFSSPKQLRLKMNRELEAAKTLSDTFEEFLKAYEYQFTNSNHNYTGLVTQTFDPAMSRYKIVNIFKSGDPQNIETVYSSDFFDWDKKTPEIEYDEISMSDLCVPFSEYDLLLVLSYLTGLQHEYSETVISGDVQETKENPAKLAFAFGWGIMQKSGVDYSFASQFCRDVNGDYIFRPYGRYDISLACNGEDGLYNRFWKEYDAFIRHSNQEVTGKFHISETELMNIKMDNIVSVNYQLMLIKQLKFKLNSKNSIAEGIFRTLKLYEPCDLANEQLIPSYIRQKYFWEKTSSEVGYPSGSIVVKIKYVYDQNYFIVNGVQVPIIYLSYLPPTEEQFNSNETRTYQYKKIYTIRTALGITEEVTSIVTLTYTPEIVNYD